MRKKLMFIIGTRPDLIKLAPIILAARADGSPFDVDVIATGQHRQMLDQMLDIFGIEVDHDLEIMQHDQTLSHITSSAIENLYPEIEKRKPDCVIVQGDTTTTFMGALAAFYNKVPIAHIEAGLRTDDKYQPFPEEINRRLTTHTVDYHFAPTEGARENLLKEGISENRIWVTGNTGIDALFLTLGKLEPVPSEKKNILVTAHRRENYGKPLENICHAILILRDRFPDTTFTYPVHHSPNVRNTVYPLLENQERISLIDPLDYKEFILAMDRSTLILTDSGGVQEEAPSLNKPVLVLRNKTERPEGVDAGALKVVGTDINKIVDTATLLLKDSKTYTDMAQVENPYGDGCAAKRILDALDKELN